MPNKDSGGNENDRMPLWEHLDALRSGLIRSIFVVSATTILTYLYSERVVYFLEKPFLDVLPPESANLYFTGIADKFMVYLKVSIICAIALTSPYLFYEIWRFLSPALYRSERKFLIPFIFFGTFSFLFGLSFAYFFMIPYGYKFLIEFGSPREKAIITLTEYFSLTLQTLLVVGLIFEFPVVIILLGKMGLVKAEFLSKHRRHAVLAIAVVSSILTPSPDLFTLMMVMLPLLVLYEISILGVKFTTRKK